MSLISFDRDSGIELPAVPRADDGGLAIPSAGLGPAIEAHIARMGLRADGFEAQFDEARAVLRIGGCADSQDMRERIVLCCGNVRGVAAIDDAMTVLMPSDVSRWRFVLPGDTLARIAADVYRDGTRITQLRAANQPLLGDSDDLQPGWLLRVPA